MHNLGKSLVVMFALFVPSVVHAEELATVAFNTGDDYATCLNRAQAALQSMGATTIRQAGDVVYGDYGQGLVGTHCEQQRAIAVATAPDEGTASSWASSMQSAYGAAYGGP